MTVGCAAPPVPDISIKIGAGMAWKKIREIKFEIYKFGPHRPLAQGASLRKYITAGIPIKTKQTLIAMVQDLLRTFATFPTPLFSQYRLPVPYLKGPTGQIISARKWF
jgi:hypothetical protein